jgi:glutaredoxin
MASKFADEVHVFSLEGCVQKGYLKRLADQQFDDKIEFNQEQIQSVQKRQKFVKFVSNVLSYPTVFFLSIFLIIAGITWLIVFTIKKIVMKIRSANSK